MPCCFEMKQWGIVPYDHNKTDVLDKVLGIPTEKWLLSRAEGPFSGYVDMPVSSFR